MSTRRCYRSCWSTRELLLRRAGEISGELARLAVREIRDEVQGAIARLPPVFDVSTLLPEYWKAMLPHFVVTNVLLTYLDQSWSINATVVAQPTTSL